ncbi:MAG: efflux RND transporter periplasmic adaptor subunit [Ignavibacteria bacterium]|nr:efflux RND transporter periplasmic adaptor subunit [Ignavibacteria bacterium]
MIILIIFSVSINGCSGDGGAETRKESEQKKTSYVKVTEIKPGQFNSLLTVVGTVKPFASAKISSEEGGLIVSLNKEKGSFVRKGELIARIKKDVELATLQQNEAQLELARINYEKQKQLYEENATTEIQYLTAKWQYEAAVRSTEILKTRLKTGFIRSPISGVVNEKYMNRGEMTAPGSPILSVIDISSVKVSAGIPERYVNEIKQGQKVKVTCNVLPGIEFEGKVTYISPSINTSNRTFEIEVVINNRQRLLKPEMSVDVSVIQLSLSDAIVLPQDYVTDNGTDKFVFVMEGDQARRKNVIIGGRDGNNVLISSGLKSGDKLIYEGFQQLSDGDKVQVIE